MFGKIRKLITDKNGKNTTVYVNPEKPVPTRVATLVQRNGVSIYIPDVPTEAHAPTVDGVWTGEKLEHEQIVINGYPSWHMAPAGYSGAYCGRCESFFTDEEASVPDAVCSVCGFKSYGGRQLNGVRANELKFFDEGVTRRGEWYHITTKASWDKNISKGEPEDQPLVHLGSLDAAKRRMRDIIKDHDRDVRYGRKRKPSSEVEFYCYKVSLNDDAVISPSVISDYDLSAPVSPAEALREIAADIREDGTSYDDRADFYSMYEMYGVTRYVNDYESHGSVSLVAHPSSFTVTERIVL